jgi:hypothetical protein
MIHESEHIKVAVEMNDQERESPHFASIDITFREIPTSYEDIERLRFEIHKLLQKRDRVNIFPELQKELQLIADHAFKRWAYSIEVRGGDYWTLFGVAGHTGRPDGDRWRCLLILERLLRPTRRLD